MGVTIRLLNSDDVETFRSIRIEALQAEPASFASSAGDWERLSGDEWRRRTVDNPVFVAFQDDVPVGIAGLIRQSASKMAHRATLVMVYVRRELRGTGVAKRLLNTVADHAREIGIRQMELAVSADNPAAIRFYNREGFAEVGRIPGGLLHEGREIDDVIKVRRIAD
ncbi:GNAT family N-acetyltransferase [Sinorhizobium medicae]|nr:GNAT family N-acetyltransferase [Sinorhizobium medicae]